MSTQLKYNKAIKAENIVYTIKANSDLKKFDLSKGDIEFLTKKLDTDSFGYIVKDGFYTIVVKSDNLKKPENKEALRKHGHSIFELLKTDCKSVQIESSNGDAIFLLMEGLALSSYQFIKYFADKDKRQANLKTAYTTNKSVDIARVNTIADATNWAKELVNEPLSYLTAERLASDVKAKCEKVGIKVDILKKS